MNFATITGIGTRLGAERRDNTWYATHRADVLRAATEKGLSRAFNTAGGDRASAGFDERMAAYVSDPFRGSTVRYILGAGESALSLEIDAARDALEAAGRDGSEIDLILCASWLPEHFVAPGDAVYIASALGVSAPAYNVETACSSGLAALELAEGMLAVGRVKRVLIVLSSTNSRQTGDDDTLGWVSSDAAAAMVVERSSDGTGILASYLENTAATCGTFLHRLVVGPEGRAVVRMSVGEQGGKSLRDSAGPDLVRRACTAAADRAGVSLDDIAFFGFSTPLAWYFRLCVDALGIDPERGHDLFPRMANLGAPFPAFQLHHALVEGRLRKGQLALLFTVGSTSSAGAMVLRVGDVGAAPLPGRSA